MLFEAFSRERPQPLDSAFEPFMDPRQLAAQRVLQQRCGEAISLYPAPFFRMIHGIQLYDSGKYTVAVETLQAAYDAAAQSGRIHIMMHCRMYMGNCYSNLGNTERMLEHYTVVQRLASALGDKDVLESIRYNIQATNIELGHIEEAYSYFSKKPSPSAMDLHKLAVCCEKLGKTGEAADALEAADEAADRSPVSSGLTKQMTALVRFRIEHPDYLRQKEYGELLLDCFDGLKKGLPSGYIHFHIPWVLEWYKANRQYRKACELLELFPDIS